MEQNLYKKKIVLIKLGGSLITDKQKPFTPKISVIDDLSRQIKEALDEDKSLQLIIGNGGGSFPHYPALKYQMNEGIKKSKQKFGFCLVQDAASRLNRIVVDSLLKHNLKALSLNPSSMIVTKNGKIKKFFPYPLFSILNLGLIPVTYGDIVFDEEKGSFILSTERILNFLALFLKKKGFKIDKVIHNGLTQGVLDEKGKTIEKITLKNFSKIEKNFYQTLGFDVTGGMLHKVKESLYLTKYGIKSFIINGTAKKNLLKKALLGEEVLGTWII
jgi:isopentenyl phosphate kinase